MHPSLILLSKQTLMCHKSTGSSWPNKLQAFKACLSNFSECCLCTTKRVRFEMWSLIGRRVQVPSRHLQRASVGHVRHSSNKTENQKLQSSLKGIIGARENASTKKCATFEQDSTESNTDQTPKGLATTKSSSKIKRSLRKKKFDSENDKAISDKNYSEERILLSKLPSLKVTSKDLMNKSILGSEEMRPQEDGELEEEAYDDGGANGGATKLQAYQMGIDDCPPALREVRMYMNKYPGKVVLTELGKFYELYFENADEYGPKLNLRVAQKHYASGQVSMAGFPSQACVKYVDQLVNAHNVSVVIVKQYLQDPLNHNTNVKKFYRKVYRIITPGTIVEQDMLDHEKNNFLLSVHLPNSLTSGPISNIEAGLAWCDISTTEFFVQKTKLTDLLNDLNRIKPSEIIINQSFEDLLVKKMELDLRDFNVTWQNSLVKERIRSRNYSGMFSEKDEAKVEGYLNALAHSERHSVFFLLDYIRQQFEINEEHLPEHNEGDEVIEINDINPSSFNFSLPVRKESENLMLIDHSAREALEITETMKHRSTKNTLFSIIKLTATPSGARMLRNWLDSPPYDLEESRKRLEFVQLFSSPEFNMHKLRIILALKQIANYDTLRLLFTISFNSSLLSSNTITNDKANVRHATNYFSLLKILRNFGGIKGLLREYHQELPDSAGSKKLLEDYILTLNVPMNLVERIDKLINKENLDSVYESLQEEEEDSLDDTSLVSSYSASVGKSARKKVFFPDMTWIINTIEKAKETSKLIKFHEELDRLLKKKDSLQKSLQKLCEEHLIKNCELRIDGDTPCVYIQFPVKAKLTGTKLNEIFGITNTLKQTKTSRTFIDKGWSQLGYSILKKVKTIKYEELRVLNLLRKDVLDQFTMIKNTSAAIDYLDVLVAFANASSELNLVCPTLTGSNTLDIVKGRHLTVEHNLLTAAAEFEANDCFLSASDKPGYIISGPNMGGKSTYLRQNAIIVILAQIGCFVPATSATIGIVDKIFTRIGSADDISNNSSTFMTEMSETSTGLLQATDRSLLIFDEIGRGTSNNEGIAMAFGILKYIINGIKCRFLFATHYAPELHRLIVINDECSTEENLNDKVSYYHTSLMSRMLNNYLAKRRDNLITSNIFNSRFFNHKLVPGISQNSHATVIAKLAGIPTVVVDNAEAAIKVLEHDKKMRSVNTVSEHYEKQYKSFFKNENNSK